LKLTWTVSSINEGSAPKGFVMRLDVDDDHLMTTRKGYAL
jgi:hypothetical protein